MGKSSNTQAKLSMVNKTITMVNYRNGQQSQFRLNESLFKSFNLVVVYKWLIC